MFIRGRRVRCGYVRVDAPNLLNLSFGFSGVDGTFEAAKAGWLGQDGIRECGHICGDQGVS